MVMSGPRPIGRGRGQGRLYGADSAPQKPQIATSALPAGVRERVYDCCMPIYEFMCPACGNTFEELSAAGTETAECPECSSAEAHRRLSAPAAPRRLSMSPDQARRLEDKRGIDRGGAKQRFKQQLARERRAGGRGGG